MEVVTISVRTLLAPSIVSVLHQDMKLDLTCCHALVSGISYCFCLFIFAVIYRDRIETTVCATIPP